MITELAGAKSAFSLSDRLVSQTCLPWHTLTEVLLLWSRLGPQGGNSPLVHTHTHTHTHTSELLLNTAVGKQAVFRCPCLNLYTHIYTRTHLHIRATNQHTRRRRICSATPSVLPQLVRLNEIALLHTYNKITCTSTRQSSEIYSV